MENKVTEKYPEMSCEEYRSELKNLFDKITDARALRFFYKFVYETTSDTPEIFKEEKNERIRTNQSADTD